MRLPDDFGPEPPQGAGRKMELLPGFEPGSLDSKSRVLTITPWERIACLKELVKSSSYGDRTHDPWLIRPMLYHLS